MTQRGFTLIELVIVIVLLGIIAVTVIARWGGQQEYELVTLRDQLVTRLRLVQLRNMNEANVVGSAPDPRCSWLRIDDDRFASATTAGTVSSCPAPAPIATWDSATLTRGGLVTGQSGVRIRLPSGSSQFALHFDRLGRPLGACLNGCVVTLSLDSFQDTVRIEAEGYIHAG